MAGRFQILENVSLTVRAGEFVSLIGPSGCGKSTMLNVIAGLEEPTAGSIYVSTVAPRLDGPALWATCTRRTCCFRGAQSWTTPSWAWSCRGVPKSEARRRAMDMAEQFGLKGFEGSYPHLLSGGMRQRVAFLRTALANQDVILLDEPFGALDALTRANMQEWLLGQWESWGKTISACDPRRR